MNLRDHAASNAPDESRATITRNSRYGLWLFGVYLLLYGAYVLTTAFAPQVMQRTALVGLNIAILSGFGLIAAAILLAFIYGWLCRNSASADETPRSPRP